MRLVIEMSKTVKKAVAGVVLAGLLGVAHADGVYVGLGLIQSQLSGNLWSDSNPHSYTSSNSQPQVTLGYHRSWGEFELAGELRTVSDYGSFSQGSGLSGLSTNIKEEGLEYSLTPGWRVSPEWKVFGRLGWVKVKTDVSGFNGSSSASQTSTVYGCGVDYSLNEQWRLRAEYRTLNVPKVAGLDGEAEGSVKSVGVSMLYQF